MATAPVQVSIQCPNGSCTEMLVEPGTTVSKIMNNKAFKPSKGYGSHLVSETAEVLEPESKIWEPQVMTLVRFKNIIQAASYSAQTHGEELVFVQIPMGTDQVEDSAFRSCQVLQEVDIANSVTRIAECAFDDCKALQRVEIPV